MQGGVGMAQKHRNTFRGRLMRAFILVALLPAAIIGISLGISSNRIIRDGFTELGEASMERTQGSIDAWIASYKDLLYQVYSDEDTIALIEQMDAGENTAVARNQLRRTLRGLLNSKEYIKSFTIVSTKGNVVFYDSLVPSNKENSWMGSIGITTEELTASLEQDNDFHYLPTHKAAAFAGKDNYLFHIGHRIVNYKDIQARYGVVILSIDETFLAELCNAQSTQEQGTLSNFCFLADSAGNILTYPDKQYLQEQLPTQGATDEEKLQAYKTFVYSTDLVQANYSQILMRHDELLNCDVIYVSDQSELEARLQNQQRFAMILLVVTLLLLLLIIVPLAQSLTRSIQHIVSVMGRVRDGDLSARVAVNEKMTMEFETMAVQYNDMMDRLGDSMEKERVAYAKQRDAEIVALEAQINPHFIYNTLDTINWMAIDREEYEIGDALTALAKIMRYSISNSNGVVSVQEELDWLKQYIVLQQLRLKNRLHCSVVMDPDAKACHIHKLLLQPFVENAIRHGFAGIDREPVLKVEVHRQGNTLIVDISDNGIGMPESLIEQINQGIFPKTKETHIGLENAVTRLRLYYGDRAMISVMSAPDEGTQVIITLPVDEENAV